MNGIKLKGLGRAVPEKIVTNEDLSRTVDTSDEWISARTGIHCRRCAVEETHLSLCVQAAKKAMDCASISPEEIGVCIVATATADTIVPSAACMLQKELNLPVNIPCFDLNAACTGFVFALHTAECMLNASSRRFGLVVGAELLSRVVDWTDRDTCILFGDGAGAAVVECREGWPSICAVMGCHGSDQHLRLPGLGRGEPNLLSMDGRKVFRFALETVPWCVNQVLLSAQCAMEDVDYFVFHQANARILDLVARKCHIPPEKLCQNIGEYGNTSAASIPLLLGDLYEQGKLQSGMKLLLTAFGGGLTWGGALVEFI